MSDDLISRKALMDKVLQEEYDNDIHKDGRAKAIHHGEYQHFYRTISEMPTAYDVDKVIEKLKKNEEDAIKSIMENGKTEFHLIKITDLKELFEAYTKEQIEIVKSGGVADD